MRPFSVGLYQNNQETTSIRHINCIGVVYVGQIEAGPQVGSIFHNRDISEAKIVATRVRSLVACF